MTDLDVTLAVIDRAVTHYTQRRAACEPFHGMADEIRNCDRWLALAARDQATLQRHAESEPFWVTVDDPPYTLCGMDRHRYPCLDVRAIFDFWSSWDE